MDFTNNNYKIFVLTKYKSIDVLDAPIWNDFFTTFFPGNLRIFDSVSNQLLYSVDALNRFDFYQEMLNRMKEANPQKFLKIHKGTPYYYMGWFQFNLRNYPSSLFYFCNAVHEDKKSLQNRKSIRDQWKDYPAFCFFRLDESNTGASEEVKLIKSLLRESLDSFNNISNANLTVEHVIHSLNEIGSNPANIELIISIYMYLLEMSEIKKDAWFIGDYSGNAQRLISLFAKGGLIFENLLVKKYPPMNNKNYITMGKIFKSPRFRENYPHVCEDINLENLSELTKYLKKFNPNLENSYLVSGKLRNYSSHKIFNEKIFKNKVNFNGVENFSKLVTYQLNSIFYALYREYINKQIKWAENPTIFPPSLE